MGRDPEKTRARTRRYYYANQEAQQKRVRENRQANPDWNREWKRKRLAWISQVKLDRGCEYELPDGSRCGYKEHPAALEFDHRDPATKSFTISARPWTALVKLEAEIAKCDVLCANHHRIRTHTEGHSRRRD